MQVDKEKEIGYYIIVMKDLLINKVKTLILREGADIKNGCVLAVGSFDGVHIGHRAMLCELKRESERLSLPAAVFTFDISDSPKANKPLLALCEKKYSLLKECGVDIVFSAPFCEVKDISAFDFATELIHKAFGARAVVCGYDFRFGAGREGNAELLQNWLSAERISVITPNPVLHNGAPVSSTLIRTLIANGEIKQANMLLGRAFGFCGSVVQGNRLGRTLGFPTVNQLYPEKLQLARFGVYAVYCRFGGKRYSGVANIGVKPTVSYNSSPLCETHIFGFNGDIYGESIEIELAEFIRGERRFSSLESLKAQVEQDKEAALKLLKECVE